MTLVFLYLAMLVLGRPVADGGPVATDAETPVDAVIKTLTGPSAPEPAFADAMPGDTPVSYPVSYKAMPGPSLRPSPEHVARAVAPQTGQSFRVAANSANVRGGQGTSHPVVGRLARNEDVLVVADPGNGWVQVRLEGDGVNGWMAKRLLRPAP